MSTLHIGLARHQQDRGVNWASFPEGPGQGWRSDLWRTHEYRYYFGGLATRWVSSVGGNSEEFVAVDELLFEFADFGRQGIREPVPGLDECGAMGGRPPDPTCQTGQR